MLKAITSVTTSEDFKIPLSEAREAVNIASNILAWRNNGQPDVFERFCVKLVDMLKSCFNTRKRSFVLKQEAMWESFHKLHLSALLKTEWQGFLGAALVVPETLTCPAFTQYVTKEVFHNLIRDLNVVPAGGQTATPDPIREEESHALRYVAGYVCRKVKHKVESSSHPDKKDIVLFLNDLKVMEEGEDSWIKRIDRGGLWHVKDCIMYSFMQRKK